MDSIYRFIPVRLANMRFTVESFPLVFIYFFSLLFDSKLERPSSTNFRVDIDTPNFRVDRSANCKLPRLSFVFELSRKSVRSGPFTVDVVVVVIVVDAQHINGKQFKSFSVSGEVGSKCQPQ